MAEIRNCDRCEKTIPEKDLRRPEITIRVRPHRARGRYLDLYLCKQPCAQIVKDAVKAALKVK
jgi:hypothetical protein